MSEGKTAPTNVNEVAPLLEAHAITKTFGDLKANDNVDFSIRKGEIHALLGENGAGKSTFVKVLFGSLQPTSGQIFWNGTPVSIRSPSEARNLGIGMVFQHFSLFEALSVAENIALSFGGKISRREVANNARKLSENYGLPLDPNSIVGDLSVGERQRVEIIRCLMQNPDLVILDEPTSVLTPQEADTLFETLFNLRDEGRSVLYISHRLEEVQRLCSAATIMRRGVMVDACDPRKETASSLAAKMVGTHINEVVHRDGDYIGGPALQIENLSTVSDNPFAVSLEDISLTVLAGEVVGIAGIAGNGQGEFFAAVSGECKQADNDCIRFFGEGVDRLGISGRRQKEAAFVPEERQGHAAVGALTLSENLLLSRHASDRKTYLGGGVLSFGALGEANTRICEAMDVRKSGDDPAAASLSGGNLQKFIMGREFDRKPKILIVNQPTWGVDAGAAAVIRQELIDLAAEGSAVVMISQDLDEIFEVADSIAVMADGRLSETHKASEMTRERVGLMMAGKFSEAA